MIEPNSLPDEPVDDSDDLVDEEPVPVPIEAEPADVIEQHKAVPHDDDEYRQ
jgi:hypothetical protein